MEGKMPPPLSAKFMDSFAYKTIKDRLPVILTKVTDSVHRRKSEIMKHYGEEGDEDLKSVIGKISKLRYEVMTDKPVSQLCDDRQDVTAWNRSIEELIGQSQEEPVKWYNSPWLFLECYMYRRLQEAVETCSLLKSLDVFEEQKRSAYTSSEIATTGLVVYLMNVIKDLDSKTEDILHHLFREFLEISLWGNKCDLSISVGAENAQTSDPLEQLEMFTPNILVNHIELIWSVLAQMKTQGERRGRVSIILDNAGFELITDLCFAEFLMSSGLASSIDIYGKAIPWFVSDVTHEDFMWTLESLCSSKQFEVSRFGDRICDHLESKRWVYHSRDFWTLPHDYSQMKFKDPQLYNELGATDLVVFKGDLNYRKLVGDLQWDTTTAFDISLRGFHPAPLCSLRTLKADVVTGLEHGQAARTAAKDADWMINGNWAVVQFCGRRES